jgi:hypothetical protein
VPEDLPLVPVLALGKLCPDIPIAAPVPGRLVEEAEARLRLRNVHARMAGRGAAGARSTLGEAVRAGLAPTATSYERAMEACGNAVGAVCVQCYTAHSVCVFSTPLLPLTPPPLSFACWHGSLI